MFLQWPKPFPKGNDKNFIYCVDKTSQKCYYVLRINLFVFDKTDTQGEKMSNKVEKASKLTPAQKKELWENIRMILILVCMAIPFIFLVAMCISYFF